MTLNKMSVSEAKKLEKMDFSKSRLLKKPSRIYFG